MKPQEVINSPVEHQVWEWIKSKNIGKKRQSGEEMTEHLLWVAAKLKEMGLDQTTVLAGLLHENNSDEDLKVIEQLFGKDIKSLVEGLKEIKSKAKVVGDQKWEQDVFRHLLIAMVGDVRVFIIRLVEQWDNSRSMDKIIPEEQQKWANMVLKLYGPLAETIGMSAVKRAIEDEAFKIIDPKGYRMVVNKFSDGQREEFKAMALVKADIEKLIAELGITAQIQNRIKGVYSSFLKFKKRGWEELKDRIALRVIVTTIEECYLVLDRMHGQYKFLEDEFNDYVANPKKNGYQSIQTTLVWRDKFTVEVQIRTQAMHDFNEFGPAAHAIYKGAGAANLSPQWIKEMSNWKGEEGDKYRLKYFDQFVYVLTPKNDVIQLPEGSTPLDFAYKIHSYLGNHAVLAKISGKAGKLNQKLKTGDVVEIVTSKRSQPNRRWLDWVVTSDAKEAIRKVVLKES